MWNDTHDERLVLLMILREVDCFYEKICRSLE